MIYYSLILPLICSNILAAIVLNNNKIASAALLSIEVGCRFCKLYYIRNEFPNFMLDAYRSEVPFSLTLTTVLQQLGSPELINLAGERFFRPPQALDHKFDRIHSIFLTVAFTAHELLLNGHTECRLIKHCQGSRQRMPYGLVRPSVAV